MMKVIFISCMVLFFGTNVLATDLSISRVELTRTHAGVASKGQSFFTDVSVQWKNAWFNKKNNDAVWIFFRFVRSHGGGSVPAKISTINHKILMNENSTPINLLAASDGMGLFIQPSATYRGNVNLRLRIELDTTVLVNTNFQLGDFLLRAYGLEMVYIPDGGFQIGDIHPKAIDMASFYKSDDNGNPFETYKIKSEDDSIIVGKQHGNLYYKSKNPHYEGDQSGIVPSQFPKGYKGFYVMKYELKQYQYTDFLNSLTSLTTAMRSKISSKNYKELRGGIYIENNVYKSLFPENPCNFVSWDDGCAYADWAGLRPMTEFEFTKAARGPVKPVQGCDYPWGLNSKNNLKRFIDVDNELKYEGGLSEATLSDTNLEEFGASYYWVIDLAGSLWERVVTIGSRKGRDFLGTHGDGQLNYGFATNSDWPAGDHNSSGFGFRGGGYYEHGLHTGGHVPHSPVEFRPFGAWSGGYANQAYGQRFVRTKVLLLND